MGTGLMLFRGLLLVLVGFTLLQTALMAGRRVALFSATFWLTLPQFARYRLKRLWPIIPGIAGLILLIWGLILLFDWLLAYYAARLGHPLG